MLRKTIVVPLLLLLVVFLPALPAQAAGSAPIDRFDIDVQLDEEGVAHVTMDFTMDFGEYSGRGPILEFVTRQDDGNDPDYWYEFDYSRPEVSSATGAETDLDVENSDRTVQWQIGDEDVVNYEAQDYTIEFTLEGIVVSDHPESGLDEFNWNVFAGNSSLTENLSITISGPQAVEEAACFTGASLQTPCDSSVSGDELHTEIAQLAPYEPLQVVAGFPAGTFGGVEQNRTRRPTLMSNLTPGVVPGVAAGILGVAAIGTGAVLRRRNNRDLVYLGLTPGTVPPRGEDARVGLKDPKKVPVAVQFQPPKDATPGEIGTLIDATADGVDVSATLVDLAVRGYIRIIPGAGRKDFTLEQLSKDRKGLEEHERQLLGDIFRGSNTRTSKDLEDEKYHNVMPGARTRLYNAMVRRHWFTSNPRSSGTMYSLIGTLLIIAGAGLCYLLWFWSLALLGIPVIVLGIGLWVAAMNASQRTAQGSAMLAQARGFELYLRTAEAGQIKFEEGIDVFSRYLPYAMIFGVAERWAKIFDELERAGQYHANRDWYVGDYASAYYVSTTMSSFSSSFSSAMSTSSSAYQASQASSGSSGGSGFSGGGGFGGGSVGSW